MKSAYFWSADDHKKLMQLWNGGMHDVGALAAQLNRRPEAVRKKLSRMRLVVGQEKKSVGTTTNKEEETRIRLKIPAELPSVEEALKLLVGALKALSQPGLSRVDIQRLAKVINSVKVYQKLFAEYVDYRGLEERLIELEKKYAEMNARDLRRVRPSVGRNATGSRSLSSRVQVVKVPDVPCGAQRSTARGRQARKRTAKLSG